jgi:hypothetical protein
MANFGGFPEVQAWLRTIKASANIARLICRQTILTSCQQILKQGLSVTGQA